ncbi:hypothetical protein BB561_000630 [Smittium simulii]|uniref:V-type proton ATPase subunit H n=1 Tax=Smittium simulii TaxID=133385 RepID=A0A2T9YY65_9FUNG|nr:hypothetical protein BB561_000630 [Smittium simulii]
MTDSTDQIDLNARFSTQTLESADFCAAECTQESSQHEFESNILISNSHFNNETALISSRTLPWEGYHNAELISEAEMHLFRSLYQDKAIGEKYTPETVKCVATILKLVDKIHRIEFVQSLLVILDQLLKYQASASVECLAYTSQTHPTIYHLLESFFDSPDSYIRLKSCKIIVSLLSFQNSDKNFNYNYTKLFYFLSSELEFNSDFSQDVSIQLLQSALHLKDSRSFLYDNNQACIQKLCEILKETANQSSSLSTSISQTQYQIGYCLWLLSFEPEISKNLNTKYNIIPSMVKIARSTLKEKVIRIMIATLKNFYFLALQPNLPSIITSGTHGCLLALKSRKIQDSDLVSDITEFLNDLGALLEKTSTWDEYVNEIKCGMLSWTPSHKSDVFWKLNYSRMNENNYEIVKILSNLIQTSQDATILAVACHDLGQYIRYYPSGKAILTDLGTKVKTMELMVHSDSQVRFQALNTIQLFMVNAWKNNTISSI